jgi:lysozyme family protein
MTDRFEACLAHVLRHEGGYVDHPADPGGATNMGITRRTLAEWRGVSPASALDKAEVKALTRAEAARIYRARYWERCAAGEMAAGLDLAVFDFAVNSGPDRAVRMLQGLLGVAVDGIVGPVTRAQLVRQHAGGGTTGLIEALCKRRLEFLMSLSTFATFGRGWRSRVEAVRKATLADARAAPPVIQPRTDAMDFLSGYRTYIIAALMALVGLAQLLGVEIPVFDGASGGQLLLEAFAIVFLRRGIETATARG